MVQYSTIEYDVYGTVPCCKISYSKVMVKSFSKITHVNFVVYSNIELRCITTYYGMVPYNTISYSKVMVIPFDRIIEQLKKSDIYI